LETPNGVKGQIRYGSPDVRSGRQEMTSPVRNKLEGHHQNHERRDCEDT